MDDTIQKWSLEEELSDPCLDGNPRIWRHFSQCVRKPEQLVGFVFGCLALGFWLISHLGVLRKRHREGRVLDKLPEAHHLLHEAGANVLNCLGAVLSHQLGTQILFGVYLLCMDALFMVQYFVFKTIRECTSRGEKSEVLKQEKEIKLKHRVSLKLQTWPLILLIATSVGGLGLPLVKWQLFGQSEPTQIHHGGRVLLAIQQKNLVSGTVHIGYIIGYLSVIFHWTSTLPTCIKTFQDRCMSWQTLAFTILGIVGNLCYVISVFCHYIDVGFFVHTLPWTLGRLGLIGIDTGLVMLSLVNYCRDPHNLASDELETERLLGDGSEDESASDTSDWETPNDLKRNKKLLKMKANNRLGVPSKEYSDTDGSPQTSPSLSKNSNRHKRRTSFQTSTLAAPPSVDPQSDPAAPLSGDQGNEWQPAWTEDDVKVELTEEQIFAVLAEEDRKRDISGTEADSQNESSKPELEEPRGEQDEYLGPLGLASAAPAGQEGDVSWFDESQEAMVDVSNEEVVDMQEG